MREIVVISGKGGTGKTSLTAAFAHLASGKIICDLDVDAPDLHILLRPQVSESHDFFSGNEAVIEDSLCGGCGTCESACRFEAVRSVNGTFRIGPLRCEGCGLCVAVCPDGAINFPQRHCGIWFVSDSRFGPLVHAQLFPGQENSGRLVTLLKQKARKMAGENGAGLILCDGTPGIGCPVISSLAGANLAVIVTEPTPSGRHDLERVASLCDHFRVKVAVIINKYDLNPEETRRIENYCRKHRYTLVARLPYDTQITEAMLRGRVITEMPESDFAVRVTTAWSAISELAVSLEEKAVSGSYS